MRTYTQTAQTIKPMSTMSTPETPTAPAPLATQDFVRAEIARLETRLTRQLYGAALLLLAAVIGGYFT